MTDVSVAALPHRTLIAISGPDWTSFLKGLCTAHIDEIVEQVTRGEFHKLHYGAFLRPQGKMICDVLLHAVAADEIWLDVPLSVRDELLGKLNMYKLRAKVTIAAREEPVYVSWNGRPEGFMADPRFGEKVGMSYGMQGSNASAEDWRAFRYATGVSDPGLDFGPDALYAIDANLDLLDAIDFHKGCYVGQELTSRMKRRGQIKNRILPFIYNGDAPAAGAEVLNGDKRAGEILGAAGGHGLALMRIDRRDGELSADSVAISLVIPDRIVPFLPNTASDQG